MKPDLLASADEAYGPPNPGMRCAEALVSKKDLGMEPAHKLSPRSFFSSSLSSSFRKKKTNKKTRRSSSLAPRQSAGSNL